MRSHASESASSERAGGVEVKTDNVAAAAHDQEVMASLGRLTARVVHELNNPLDGILRYVNLAIRRCDAQKSAAGRPPDEVVQHLTAAREGLLRMTRIVREVLQFSRGRASTLDAADVNEVVEAAVRSLAPAADEAGVLIAADYQLDGMPRVVGGRLHQICVNLIKNAIEAMPEGGRLFINTAVVGTDVVLRFSDTGPGLPDSLRLFEPFETSKPPGAGTGLGLAICRELAGQMGGAIHARNAEGGGAVLTVTIPRSGCLRDVPEAARAVRTAPSAARPAAEHEA